MYKMTLAVRLTSLTTLKTWAMMQQFIQLLLAPRELAVPIRCSGKISAVTAQGVELIPIAKTKTNKWMATMLMYPPTCSKGVPSEPVMLKPIAAITQKVVISGRVPSMMVLRPSLSIMKTLQVVPIKFVSARGMFKMSALSSDDKFSKVMPDFSIIRGP